MQKHTGLKMKQKENVCDIRISNMMNWKKMSPKPPQRWRCWNLLLWIMLCLTGLTGITWISLQVLWGFGRALTGISNEPDNRVWRCCRRTSKPHWTLHENVCYPPPPHPPPWWWWAGADRVVHVMLWLYVTQFLQLAVKMIIFIYPG